MRTSCPKRELILTSLLLSTTLGIAAPLIIINYQGKITRADGTPLERNRTVVKISVFDTLSLGTRIWGPQTFTNVPLAAGTINVIVGPVDDAGRPLLQAFSSGGRYLEVSVGGELPIVPRQMILNAPFALQAGNDVQVGGIIPWVPPVPLEGLTLAAASQLIPVGFSAQPGVLAPSPPVLESRSSGAAHGARTRQRERDLVPPPGSFTLFAWSSICGSGDST